jgi:hypothetical protein
MFLTIVAPGWGVMAFDHETASEACASGGGIEQERIF